MSDWKSTAHEMYEALPFDEKARIGYVKQTLQPGHSIAKTNWYAIACIETLEQKLGILRVAYEQQGLELDRVKEMLTKEEIEVATRG